MLWLLHILTHWGRVTHICVGKLTIIGSDNGLSPGRRQAIIWTNAGIWLIGPLGTIFSEILIEILTFSFKKMRLKVSSAKRRPFCLGLNVLIHCMTHSLVWTCGAVSCGWFVPKEAHPRPPLGCQMTPQNVLETQHNKWSNLMALGICGSNFKSVFSEYIYGSSSWAFLVKLFLNECRKTPFIVSQYWFR